jgi:prepilin-type N-terminal cleavage/methylation domain-containing protein
MEYLRKIIKNNRRGFTLIEVLVAMSIFSLVILLSNNYIITTFRSLRYGSEFNDAVVNGRRAIEIISKEIRGANNSDRGDYPIALAEGHDLIFYSDIDYDGDFDRVRYLIQNRTLYKTVTQPGLARDYTGTPATTTIANYINNGSQEAFIYFDGSVAETADLDMIRLIRSHLLFNVTPGMAPDDILVQTDVNLRNLKNNL